MLVASVVLVAPEVVPVDITVELTVPVGLFCSFVVLVDSVVLVVPELVQVDITMELVVPVGLF